MGRGVWGGSAATSGSSKFLEDERKCLLRRAQLASGPADHGFRFQRGDWMFVWMDVGL